MDVLDAKRVLRGTVQQALSRMSEDERERASTAARERLVSQPEWRRARAVLLFAPMAWELDVWPLAREVLESGRVLALPCYNRHARGYEVRLVKHLEEDIAAGYYGIREPGLNCEMAHVNQLDLLVVPGVAFDRHGHRLGRGKGYYDRLLCGACGTKCGTGFDQQLVDRVPVAAHDIRLDCILTPTHWIRTSGEPLE